MDANPELALFLAEIVVKIFDDQLQWTCNNSCSWWLFMWGSEQHFSEASGFMRAFYMIEDVVFFSEDFPAICYSAFESNLFIRLLQRRWSHFTNSLKMKLLWAMTGINTCGEK